MTRSTPAPGARAVTDAGEAGQFQPQDWTPPRCPVNLGAASDFGISAQEAQGVLVIEGAPGVVAAAHGLLTAFGI